MKDEGRFWVRVIATIAAAIVAIFITAAVYYGHREYAMEELKIIGRVPEPLKRELDAFRNAWEWAVRNNYKTSARCFMDMYLETCEEIPKYQDLLGVPR